MKKTLLVLVVLAAISACAALPLSSLPSLSEVLAQFAEATNKIATLRANLAERAAAYASLSNALAAIGGNGGFAAATNDLMTAINASDRSRIALHGPRTCQHVLTNAVTRRIYRVDEYADGYAHVLAAKEVAPLDPEGIAKLREQAAKKTLESLRAFEAAKYPAAVAALLEERRRALGITNVIEVVTIVIPEGN